MDIWLLKSMLFVTLAIFECAMLLSFRFGKGRSMTLNDYEAENKERKCNQVDKICLLMFMGTYIIAVVTYFIVVTQSK